MAGLGLICNDVVFMKTKHSKNKKNTIFKQTSKTPKKIKLGGVIRRSDVPATQATLYHVRNELKFEIKSLRTEMRLFKIGIEGQFKKLGDEVKSELHRVCASIEEQNARNAVVLDGLNVLFKRQDRIENEYLELKNSLNIIP